MNRIQRVRRFRLASLALSVVAVLSVSLPVAVPVLAAGGGSIYIGPATVPAAGPGSTFTVTISSIATPDNTTGVQASVTFDKSLLQITSVTRPTTSWGTAPIFVGPTGDLTVAANMTAAINNANGSGKLASIAANLAAGVSLPESEDHGFLNVTFQVIGCPVAPATTTALGIPVGPADGALNDTLGDPLNVTGDGATVTPCALNTGNNITRVASTLDAGFLALEVNPTLAMPLNRQVTNQANVPVKVFSDGTWTLNVADSLAGGKLEADRGHMTDGNPATKRLASAMTAQYDGLPVVDLDQPIANTNVLTDFGNATPVVTLRQFVGPSDPPAAYTMTLVFTATSGF